MEGVTLELIYILFERFETWQCISICLFHIFRYWSIYMSVNFNSDISLLKLCGISNSTISAAGASFLSLSHCLREIASAMQLDRPLMWHTFTCMPHNIVWSTSGRINYITLFDLDDLLLTSVTSALLSVWNIIIFRDSLFLNKCNARTIGTSSRNVISRIISSVCYNSGHRKNTQCPE
jgi:hypothetical protein